MRKEGVEELIENVTRRYMAEKKKKENITGPLSSGYVWLIFGENKLVSL